MRGEISLVVDKVIAPEGKESVVRDGRYWEFSDGERIHARFDEGESIAVVMNYREAGLDERVFGGMPGWIDRRRVDARYMPHRVVIDRVRCLRVQDLTEEDALRVGLVKNKGGYYLVGGAVGGADEDWRRMLECLFNECMSNIPYKLNPWVLVYDVTPVIGHVAREL